MGGPYVSFVRFSVLSSAARCVRGGWGGAKQRVTKGNDRKEVGKNRVGMCMCGNKRHSKHRIKENKRSLPVLNLQHLVTHTFTETVEA